MSGVCDGALVHSFANGSVLLSGEIAHNKMHLFLLYLSPVRHEVSFTVILPYREMNEDFRAGKARLSIMNGGAVVLLLPDTKARLQGR